MRLYRPPKRGKSKSTYKKCSFINLVDLDDVDTGHSSVEQETANTHFCPSRNETQLLHHQQCSQLPQPRRRISSSFSSKQMNDIICYYQYISHNDTMERHRHSFYHCQNVWVCKSKGNKCSRYQNNDSTETSRCVESSHTNAMEFTEDISAESATGGSSLQRYELFSRAIVVDDNNDNVNEDHGPATTPTHNYSGSRRLCVQYPKGSTYHVRTNLLIPIYDKTYIQRLCNVEDGVVTRPHSDCESTNKNDSIITTTTNPSYPKQQLIGLVLIYPETNIYRRACKVHTMKHDHFIEIGCAEGHNCSRIRDDRVETESLSKNDVSVLADVVDVSDDSNQGIVLGIDKSISCIQIARDKFGRSDLYFVPFDIFQPTAATIGSEPINNNDTSAKQYTPIVQTILNSLTEGYANSFENISGNNIDDNNIDVTPDLFRASCNDRINVDLDESRNGSNRNDTVVAIDINGNRDIEPILKCIQIIMNSSLYPRLIIVKSRSLYQYVTTRHKVK